MNGSTVMIDQLLKLEGKVTAILDMQDVGLHIFNLKQQRSYNYEKQTSINTRK